MSTELQTKEAKQNQEVAEQKEAVHSIPRSWRRPQYRVADRADAFDVQIRMPGVNREGVDISLEQDTLTILGKYDQTIPEGWRALRRESSASDYKLTLQLNVAVDDSKIEARIEDGILELSLPKADSVKARKIQVS